MTIILSRVAYALEGYWKNRKKEKKEKSFLIYWLKKLIPFVLKSLPCKLRKLVGVLCLLHTELCLDAIVAMILWVSLLIVGLRYI